MNRLKNLLAVLALCAMSLAASAQHISHRPFKHYGERVDEFEKLPPIKSTDVVMLGNSLTEFGYDWNELVAQYNEDPGMMAGASHAETGYAVCENMSGFVAAFTAAAMGLEKVGDVSDPAAGLYGYYIIRYESDVAEGPVELTQEIRDDLHGDLLSTKQDEYYNQQVTEWVNAATVEKHLDWLND